MERRKKYQTELPLLGFSRPKPDFPHILQLEYCYLTYLQSTHVANKSLLDLPLSGGRRVFTKTGLSWARTIWDS